MMQPGKKNRETFIPIQQLLNEKQPSFALFALAFRPFFLFASLFSALHILLWVYVWLGKWIPDPNIQPSFWHAHEMIFGYAFGIVTGFLLTAVTNWTGLKTPSGKPLIVMFSLWLVARLCFLFGLHYFYISAICDVLFAITVLIAFSLPVIKSKNKRQHGFIAKLALIVLTNALFYFGALTENALYERYAIYFGLYLILAIVLVMGRRVIPFFTKRALNLSEDIKNPIWLDISSIVLFAAFAIWDSFFPFSHPIGLAVISFFLFVLYAIRLCFWYQKGLFAHPLIWVLWLANAVFFTGFLLKVLELFGKIPPYLATHAFTMGGIGLMTVGMMARVSLGHTGRNVFAPPKAITPMFLCILLAIILRLVLPLFDKTYRIGIMSSATFWALAMLIFVAVYAGMLIKPRIDCKAG